ncbi:MAG: chemotaxis protein CheC [Lachnospiraceae bacterium]|nr:chemotaxis protein CheC [Lachnospiraceae bacterium]
MGGFSLDHLSQIHYDVLKEIGNIGAGNATTALATMLGCKVDMHVPQVRLLEFKDVGALIGGEEQIVVGVYLAVEGDITGSMMFLVELESAKNLVSKLMGGMPITEFGEMELSAMQEVGNIITGSYLNSLATLTNMKIYPNTPNLAVDMAGAILSVPAIEFGMMGDKILLIETVFTDDIELNGFFIMIPDLESDVKIFSALGISLEN